MATKQPNTQATSDKVAVVKRQKTLENADLVRSRVFEVAELFYKIFSLLPIRSIVRLERVCKNWHSMLQSERFWKNLALVYYPPMNYFKDVSFNHWKQWMVLKTCGTKKSYFPLKRELARFLKSDVIESEKFSSLLTRYASQARSVVAKTGSLAQSRLAIFLTKSTPMWDFLVCSTVLLSTTQKMGVMDHDESQTETNESTFVCISPAGHVLKVSSSEFHTYSDDDDDDEHSWTIKVWTYDRDILIGDFNVMKNPYAVLQLFGITPPESRTTCCKNLFELFGFCKELSEYCGNIDDDN